jgi:hypothetical protein
MRDRFLAKESWEVLGLPLDECLDWVDNSESMKMFRSALFSPIVPTMKEIGPWGPRIRKAYEDMGIIGFSQVATEVLAKNDEKVAEAFDSGDGPPSLSFEEVAARTVASLQGNGSA